MSTSTRSAVVKRPEAEATQWADRALRLLTSFTPQQHTLSARQLAAITGIPLPSTYRYIAIMRQAALLVGDEQGGYHLSARFVTLAQAAEAADGLIAAADPAMRGLASDTGETVLLVRLISDAAVCVHRIESTHHLRISFEPGQPMSLERGASAKVLLSAMRPERSRALVASLRTRDPARAAILEREIVLTRRQGWATSTEEIDPGIWAAAALVNAGHGRFAALSVPSPLVRSSDEVRTQLLTRVRAAAAEISAVMAAGG
jgi:DNA-binding IclR family transcriptional regulator